MSNIIQGPNPADSLAAWKRSSSAVSKPKPSLAGVDSPEQAQKRLERLDAFKEMLDEAKFEFHNVWLNEGPPTTSYSWVDVTGPNYLIEVFSYTNQETPKELEGGVLELINLDDPIPPVVFPVGKIIKKGDGFSKEQAIYEVGDFVRLPNQIAYLEYNEAWLQYKETIAKTRPTPNIIAPPKFRGIITDWQTRYRVPASVTNPYDDSMFVFQLPAGIIQGKVNRDEIIQD